MDIMNLFQDYFVEGDDTNVRPPASKESKATQTNTEEPQLEGKLPEIKDLCLRSDLSALAKIDQILSIIDPSLVQRVNSTPTPPRTEAGKRPADLSAGNVGLSCSKIPKFDIETDIKTEMMDSGGCAVCGISLTEFRNDSTRELVHYLSHGLSVLKEFDVLKSDDTLFLMCNLCSSVYPRKCQKTFRNHLVT